MKRFALLLVAILVCWHAMQLSTSSAIIGHNSSCHPKNLYWLIIIGELTTVLLLLMWRKQSAKLILDQRREQE